MHEHPCWWPASVEEIRPANHWAEKALQGPAYLPFLIVNYEVVSFRHKHLLEQEEDAIYREKLVLLSRELMDWRTCMDYPLVWCLLTFCSPLGHSILAHMSRRRGGNASIIKPPLSRCLKGSRVLQFLLCSMSLFFLASWQKEKDGSTILNLVSLLFAFLSSLWGIR